MKIARFQSLSTLTTFVILTDLDPERYASIYGPDRYRRVSEWVEVEFQPRDIEDTAREQLEALDSAEERLKKDHHKRLTEISVERSKLRARVQAVAS